MIQLRSNVITISDDRGTEIFDPAELELRLARCCRAVGMREEWLPEDLALAVEDALLHAGERRTYRRDEIHRFVLKVLRDLGLGELAAAYQQNTRPAEEMLAPDAPAIPALLMRHLGLPATSATALAAQFATACQHLGLTQAAPALVVELSRHLREAEPVTLPALASAPASSRHHPPTLLISRQEILAAMATATELLPADDILTPASGVSQLFPALKLDLRMTRLAAANGWCRPVTEMVVMPAIPKLADAITAITRAVRTVARQRGQAADLPLILRCPDLPSFTTDWLGATWPAGSETGTAVIAPLANLMPPPARIILPPTQRQSAPPPI